eukprot:14610826-Ditylum_brightwellii.AAC.1
MSSSEKTSTRERQKFKEAVANLFRSLSKNQAAVTRKGAYDTLGAAANRWANTRKEVYINYNDIEMKALLQKDADRAKEDYDQANALA